MHGHVDSCADLCNGAYARVAEMQGCACIRCGNSAPVQVKRTPIPREDYDWLRDTVALLRNALADSVRLVVVCN